MFIKKLMFKFIEIISIEESFFFQQTIEKKIKLSDDLIKLNYNRYSPIKDAKSIYTKENDNLYLWFYKRESSKPIIIPQAFILFMFYKKQYDNHLITIKNSNNYYILIIKESSLLSVFSKKSIDEQLINITLNKYNLTSVINIDNDTYKQSYSDFLKHLSFSDILRWNKFHLNKNDLLQNSIIYLSYPLSFLLILSMGLHIYHSKKLNLQLKELQTTYIEVKNSNKEIKERFQIAINHQKKWLDFTKNEFPYGSNITIINKLHKSFIGKAVKLKNCSILGSNFKLTIETKDDFIIYLNLLNKIEFFKDVTIKNVNRKRNRVSYEAHIIPIKLKEK